MKNKEMFDAEKMIDYACGYFRVRAEKERQKADLLEALWKLRVFGVDLSIAMLEEERRKYAPNLAPKDFENLVNTVEHYFPADEKTDLILEWLRREWRRGPRSQRWECIYGCQKTQ